MKSLRTHLLLATFVAVVAAAARIYRLGDESLWIDEAIAWGRASLPLKDLLADTAARKHVPTYFLLLRAWIQLGDSEWVLRFPSAMLGVLTAVLGYAIGAVASDRRAGLAAGLLLGVSPIQVHYGQEARMYTLLTFAAGAATLALVLLACDLEKASASPTKLFREARGADAPGRARARVTLAAWSGLVAASVLALYTHNIAVLFIAALNLAALSLWHASHGSRGAFARNWLLAQGAAFLAWTPWLPTLLRQTASIREKWSTRYPTPARVWGPVEDLFLSSSHGWLALLLVGSAVLSVRAWRGRAHVGVALVVLAFAAPALALAISFEVPMFYRRTLLWTALPWLVLVGAGVAVLPRRAGLVAGAVLIALSIAPLGEYYGKETKPAWRDLLTRLVQDTDAKSVILSGDAGRFTRYYFGRKTDPMPRRSFKRVSNRARPLERYVKQATRFWLVGQTHEGSYKGLVRQIRKDRTWRLRWRLRSKDAIVLAYERRPETRRRR